MHPVTPYSPHIETNIGQPRNIIYFISDIVACSDKLSDIFTLPELEALLRANAATLLEERENEGLLRDLLILAHRLDQEFVSLQAPFLAASIRSLVDTMENPARPPAKKERLQPAKETAAHSIYRDVTDAKLTKLLEKNKCLEHMSVQSDSVTKIFGSQSLKSLTVVNAPQLATISEMPSLRALFLFNCPKFRGLDGLDSLECLHVEGTGLNEIPTLTNLRMLFCKEEVYIHPQPKLERLSCDPLKVTLERPVSATCLNSKNHDFLSSQNPSQKSLLFKK